MKLSAQSIFIQVFEELQRLNDAQSPVSKPVRNSASQLIL